MQQTELVWESVAERKKYVLQFALLKNKIKYQSVLLGKRWEEKFLLYNNKYIPIFLNLHQTTIWFIENV